MLLLSQDGIRQNHDNYFGLVAGEGWQNLGGFYRHPNPLPVQKSDQAMKLIALNQGQITQVDDEDFEYLNNFKWFLTKGFRTSYVQRQSYKKSIIMHRLIMNTPKNLEVDHIDGNGLNNQKNNLRICTHAENGRNKNKGPGSSKYKGVSIRRSSGKWESNIKFNGKRIYIGIYSSEFEAAKAYDKKSTELFGRFSKPNFK